LADASSFEVRGDGTAIDVECLGWLVEISAGEVAVDELIDLGCTQPGLVLLGSSWLLLWGRAVGLVTSPSRAEP
jgi:hypothetical protein